MSSKSRQKGNGKRRRNGKRVGAPAPAPAPGPKAPGPSVTVDVRALAGSVVVNFDRPIAELRLNAAEAQSIGTAILGAAARASEQVEERLKAIVPPDVLEAVRAKKAAELEAGEGEEPVGEEVAES